MDSKRFIWSVEKESALIDLIQEKPALWNPTNINYSKKTYKKHLFEIICQEMIRRWPEAVTVFTPTFIQVKFSSLRSYFQREERKFKANSGAAGFDFSPKWVHYQRLQFLKDCSMVAPSESTLDSSMNGLDSSMVEDESQATLTTCENLLDNSSNNGETSASLPAEVCIEEATANLCPIPTGPPRKKKKRSDADELLVAATSALQNLGSRQGQASLFTSVGQVVTFTLESLTNAQQQQQCVSDIFLLLSKYTNAAASTGLSSA